MTWRMRAMTGVLALSGALTGSLIASTLEGTCEKEVSTRPTAKIVVGTRQHLGGGQ